MSALIMNVISHIKVWCM